MIAPGPIPRLVHAAALLALLWLFAAPAAAQAAENRVEVNPDYARVSLEVDDAPLYDVLQQLAAEAGFALEWEGALDERIGLRLNEVPLAEALDCLLGDRAHVVWFDPPAGPDAPRRVAKLLVIDRAPEGGAAGAARAGWVPAAPVEPPFDPAAEEREQLKDVSRLMQGEAGVTAPELEALEAALDDPNPAVRRRAVEGYAYAAGPAAAERLEALARAGEDPAVRLAALQNLVQRGGPAAARAAEAACLDPDPTVRATAEAFLAG